MDFLVYTFLLNVLVFNLNAQRVLNIGNEIKASASGVDVTSTTFLLDNIVLAEGVVFAYSAFFRSDSAVSLQIWRPWGNESEVRTFRLVSQLRVIPAGIYQREDIYVESRLTEQCTRVHTGDRLGVFIEEAPGAIAYTFDPSQPTTLAAIRHSEKNMSYGLGDAMTFDKLTFPYDFSVSAYVDTDLSQYPNPRNPYPDCPKGLLIPTYGSVFLPSTVPPSPLTGKPGDTGATGPVGPEGAIGATGATGFIGLEGAIGSTGPVGATGATGQKGGMGATGRPGKDGIVGATGITGPKGDRGEIGLPGPPGPSVDVNSSTFDPPVGGIKEEDQHALSNPMLILGILIWLVILTILLLIILIVLLILYRQKKKEEDEKWNQVKKNNSFLFDIQNIQNTSNKDEAWIQKLKEETESSYSVDTIEVPERKNRLRSRQGNSPEGFQDSGHMTNGSYLSSNTSHGAINTIYENLDIPRHELTNY